jgi:hypothetical protein
VNSAPTGGIQNGACGDIFFFQMNQLYAVAVEASGFRGKNFQRCKAGGHNAAEGLSLTILPALLAPPDEVIK